MGGVYSINDLRNLFNQTNDVLLHREIRNLEKENILKRFKQGFYVTETFNPELLACRMYPDAYISCTTVLARHLVIGSVPSKTIYAAKSGRNKLFESRDTSILYFGIQSQLMFAIKNENGIRYASIEKAFIDTLYFYQKGNRFLFNIFTDVNFMMINREKVISMLGYYKNLRFVSFVRGVIESYEQ